jgi:hypothetical protein
LYLDATAHRSATEATAAFTASIAGVDDNELCDRLARQVITFRHDA